jgi:Zn-dependent peptidase ImmA (M78 family)
MGIITPEDIELRTISYKLGIHLTFTELRSYSRDEGNFKISNINKNLDQTSQREIFFHELCHILRHEGYQYKRMPSDFRDLQEWDAYRFTRYAAIPLHMLKYLNWKSPFLVKEMSRLFTISEEVCQSRIEHIYRNSKVGNA